MKIAGNRESKLQHWAQAQLRDCFKLTDSDPIEWSMVAGDASARQYHRALAKGRSYIVMDAPPAQENIMPFIQVAEQMRKANLPVPAIYASDERQGFMLLQDFGDTPLKALLQAETGQQLFDRVLPLLTGMLECPTTTLPQYSAEKLHNEMQLFVDWYLAIHKNEPISEERTAEQWWQWQQLSKLLVESALSQPQIFVHRDFHSCNLQVLPDNSIGMIDFQDAVSGPVSYDLVSWLWDRYVTWPRTDLERWMLQAREKLAPHIEAKAWIRLCDFMGLQRNLKIVGIFSRLHYRDHRAGYLEMIPRFSAYLQDIIPRYDQLAECGDVVLRYLDVDKQ